MCSSTRQGYATVLDCLCTGEFKHLGPHHGRAGQSLNIGRIRVKTLVRRCTLLLLVF